MSAGCMISSGKPNTLCELAPSYLWAGSQGVVGLLPRGCEPAGSECWVCWIETMGRQEWGRGVCAVSRADYKRGV